MIKLAVIGIITVAGAVFLRKTKEDYALCLVFAGCCIILLIGLDKLEIIIDSINKLESYINIKKSYVVLLLKVVGITYISEFASSICKDAGYASVASQIEFVGKLSILAISMPILMTLLETVNNFLLIR